MKKTLQISIAEVLFTIEEDAYSSLAEYLASVKEHFAHTEGSSEIISDIENRIAELLLDTKQKIITLSTIEKILSSIGKVEDFDDAENITKEEKASQKNGKEETAQKKLYRNPDDVIIAGVCSGLASYFGIDTVLVRIIFVALIFSGFGVMLYIALWLIIPIAKTGAQKLEMSGSPVTLETISSAVNERFEDIKNNKSSALRDIVTFIFKTIGSVFKFLFKIIIPTIRIFTGVLLIIISTAWTMGTMVAGGFLFSGAFSVDGISLGMLVSSKLSLILIASLVLFSIIPALFTFLGGISLLRKKIVLPTIFLSSLFGIWFIVLFVLAFGSTKVAHNYDVFTETSPTYQSITEKSLIVDKFTSVQISDGINIKIEDGDSNEITKVGRVSDISLIRTQVVDGVLIIDKKPDPLKSNCTFCISTIKSPALTLNITDMPEMINLERGASLYGDFSKTDPLSVVLKNGSRGNITTLSKKINVKVSGGSDLHLLNDEIASSLEVYLENGSHLDAGDFSVKNVKIEASSGSSALLRVKDMLDANLKNGSSVSYIGSPEIIKKVSTGSSLRIKSTNNLSK